MKKQITVRILITTASLCLWGLSSAQTSAKTTAKQTYQLQLIQEKHTANPETENQLQKNLAIGSKTSNNQNGNSNQAILDKIQYLKEQNCCEEEIKKLENQLEK